MPRSPSPGESVRPPALQQLLLDSVLEIAALPAADRALELDVRENARRCETIVRAIEGAQAQRPRILEVGLGFGYVTTAARAILGDRAELYALEHPSRDYVGTDRLRRYLRRVDVQFATYDLTRDPIPWPELTFDAIVLGEVIEHLSPERLPPLLTSLRARLHAGGRLVVTSPNLQSLQRRLSFALGRSRLFDAAIPIPEAGGTFGHIRLYNRDEVAALFEHANLALVDWEWLNWEHVHVGRGGPARTAVWAAQRFLPRLVPSLATSWLAVGEPRAGRA